MSSQTSRWKEISQVKNGSVEEHYSKQKEKHRQMFVIRERLCFPRIKRSFKDPSRVCNCLCKWNPIRDSAVVPRGQNATSKSMEWKSSMASVHTYFIFNIFLTPQCLTQFFETISYLMFIPCERVNQCIYLLKHICFIIIIMLYSWIIIPTLTGEYVWNSAPYFLSGDISLVVFSQGLTFPSDCLELLIWLPAINDHELQTFDKRLLWQYSYKRAIKHFILRLQVTENSGV